MFMAASVTPNELVVDLEDLDTIKRFLPVLEPLMGISGAIQQAAQPTSGGEGAESMEDMDLKTLLDTLEGVGRKLDAKGKSVRVRNERKDVVVLGRGARSLLMGLGGYGHVDIKRKLFALKLAAMLKGAFNRG